LSKKTRRKSNFEASTSEAMVVRGRTKEREHVQRYFTQLNSKVKKRKNKFWFCGKSRHLKKDCWKKKQTTKEDPPKETKETNATETC
jgi:hypothetical protein